MATADIILIAGIPVTPGTQLTPTQMAVISLSLSMGNTYPDYIMSQFYAQGGSATQGTGKPAPVANSSTPATSTVTPVSRSATPVSPAVNPQAPAAIDTSSSLKARAKANAAQNPVSPTVDPAAAAALTPPAPNSKRQFNTTGGGATTALQPRSQVVQAAVTNARNQPVQQVILGNEASNGDWRLRLSLGQNADYFYNDPNNPGILQPLKSTNGVIFPYTPKIDIGYKTNYQSYDVTHSNFRGHYYQNSQVGDITISAQFTAQNTDEANYLLAVIHFFRSVGKMFYGQDAQRGTPPPLLFLTGLGEYQFNKHPVLLSSFTYGLPNDVDYIRTNVANQTGTNLTERNNVKTSTPTSSNAVSSDRLSNAGLTQGALPNTPFGSAPTTPELASGAPTYVPTKIDISIALLPVNTRQQISNDFSLKQFANGNLLRGGFW